MFHSLCKPLPKVRGIKPKKNLEGEIPNKMEPRYGKIYMLYFISLHQKGVKIKISKIDSGAIWRR